MHQVLDDIYSKIVQPLQADVYVVTSDELWVGVQFPFFFSKYEPKSAFSLVVVTFGLDA